MTLLVSSFFSFKAQDSPSSGGCCVFLTTGHITPQCNLDLGVERADAGVMCSSLIFSSRGKSECCCFVARFPAYQRLCISPKHYISLCLKTQSSLVTKAFKNRLRTQEVVLLPQGIVGGRNALRNFVASDHYLRSLLEAP